MLLLITPFRQGSVNEYSLNNLFILVFLEKSATFYAADMHS
jgi:hypothetical protein